MRWPRISRSGSGRLFLHIGTPKSATTYVQARLSGARPELARRGVLYPGAGYLPKAGLNQQPAVYGAAGTGVHWVNEEVRANGRRHLDRMRREIARHGGDVIVSAEALASFPTAEAQHVLDLLDRPAERVRIVITARDPGRLLGSVWQQNVKNGATTPQRDYLESVARLRDRTDLGFWAAYGVPGLVGRWGSLVGVDRVTLVTVPHDRTLMWPRFAQAVDLADLPAAPVKEIDPTLRNVSLTATQVELLREMNVLLNAEVESVAERQRLRRTLLQAWMSSPAQGDAGTPLDEALTERVAQWAAEDVAALRRLVPDGLTVIGDLDELIPRRRPARTVPRPSGPSVQDLAADVLRVVRHSTPPVGTR